jgi:hypothetical protein
VIPGLAYGSIPTGVTPFSSAFTSTISTTNPSSPSPVQGQCFPNCSFIAALTSIAWVNRNFILKNVSGPDGKGNYTFNFCDYGVNNTVTLPNDNTKGTNIPVTVSPNVLLDSTGNISNANGFYGAGSSNANEVWPALYERAYAKFCMYENNLTLGGSTTPMSATDLTDTTKDPAYADLVSLSQNAVENYWGGNAAFALMYLTGLNCFTLSTQTTSFPTSTTGGVSGNIGTQANGASPAITTGSASANGTPLTSMGGLYTYIEGGFCVESTKVYGMYKTRYPLVATTYIDASHSPNPTAVTFGNGTIVPNHNYSVLGVFDAPNGYHYIILRTTFGSNPNYPNPTFSGVASGSWSFPPSASPAPYDAQFLMQGSGLGGVLVTGPQYPSNNKTKIPMNVNLSSTNPNAIFGLEQGAFINYFSTIGWAQGY